MGLRRLIGFWERLSISGVLYEFLAGCWRSIIKIMRGMWPKECNAITTGMRAAIHGSVGV